MSAPEGKITKQLLKTHSGQFDLESIHSLSLKYLDISDLGCIGECVMLERLDLSCNDITKLYLLAGLTSVYYLNLSANRISSLEGLQSLDNLQSLNLSGNLIGSVDTLRCLGILDKLTDLRLQDKSQGLTNPVCMNNTYKNDVLSVLPNLRSLDGERVSGPGSDLYLMCSEIDKLIAASPAGSEITVPEPSPWALPDFTHADQTFEKSSLGDAQQQLQALLGECKRISSEADSKIQSAIEKTAT